MKLVHVFIIALAALTGCAASSAHMKSTTYSAQPPPAGKAAVVFLRPSELGYAIGFEVFDGKGRYLGEALSEKFFETLVDPGEHWFYADAENAGVLKAELAAGKRYYVVVRPFMGAWSARVELTALAPRSEDWSKLSAWISGSEAQSVDEAAGQSALDARRGEIQEVIAEGNEIWNEADAAWRAEHTLLLEDEQETGAPSAPAPPPEPMPEPATPAAPAEPVPPTDSSPMTDAPSATPAPTTPAPATPATPAPATPVPAPAP